MLRTQSVAEAVGDFLAKTRREHGLTLDQIARHARLYGAHWSASSVGNIEGGKAAMTLPLMLHLAMTLGSLTGKRLSLIDLLGDAGAITLTQDPSSAMTREWLNRMLAGAPVEATPDDLAWIHDVAEERAFDELDAASKTPPGPRGVRVGSSLAEERAAVRLGVDVPTLQRLAQEAWSDTLEAEARRRAGEGSSPQARGRVTRVLIDEIRARLEAGA